jgi:hypothetical protein
MPAQECRILPDLQLAGRALHEFYASGAADGTVLAGVVLASAVLTGAVGALAQGAEPAVTLWIRHSGMDREYGAPYPPGLVELGLDPSRIILVLARDAQSALQAGLEGARCAALGAVLIELSGEARMYDLTASRRWRPGNRAQQCCWPALLPHLCQVPRKRGGRYRQGRPRRWRPALRETRPLN